MSMFLRQDAELAQPGIELGLCVVADAAGVDHHHVRISGIVGGFVAGLFQES